MSFGYEDADIGFVDAAVLAIVDHVSTNRSWRPWISATSECFGRVMPR